MTVTGDNDAEITTSLNLPKNSFPDIWTPSKQQLLEFQHSVAVPFALVPAPADLAELPAAAALDEEVDVLAQPAPLALLPFQRGAVDEGHVAFLDMEFKDDETTVITKMKLVILRTMRWISKKMIGRKCWITCSGLIAFNLNLYSAVD